MTQGVPDLIPAWVEGQLQRVEKLAVHQLGLRHKAVSVFVLQGDQVLLQRRAEGKYHTPGLWANTCCTHPAWGESALDCAHRRLRQELGIAGLTLKPAGQVEYRAEVGQGLTEHEVVDVFVASIAHRPAVAADPAEVAETRWMGLADLIADLAANPRKYTPWLRIYLDQHRDQIFGA
jgi:isopentenyl-diphosphate delta-isomerase